MNGSVEITATNVKILSIMQGDLCWPASLSTPFSLRTPQGQRLAMATPTSCDGVSDAGAPVCRGMSFTATGNIYQHSVQVAAAFTDRFLLTLLFRLLRIGHCTPIRHPYENKPQSQTMPTTVIERLTLRWKKATPLLCASVWTVGASRDSICLREHGHT